MKTHHNNYTPMSFITAIRVLHKHLSEKPKLSRKERRLLQALDRCYYVKNHDRIKVMLWGVASVIVTIFIMLILFT